MTTIALVQEAILALKDRTGSSVQAIDKWIETEKKVAVPEKHVMKAALDKAVKDGTLVEVNLSYKLSAETNRALTAREQCGMCGLMKRLDAEDGFTLEQWQQRSADDRRCLSCLNGTSSFKVCRGEQCYNWHTSIHHTSIHLKPLPREQFHLAQWDRQKPLCKSCEDIDLNSKALGVGCPLTSWAKLVAHELPIEIDCEGCNGQGCHNEDRDDTCWVCDGAGAIIGDEPVKDDVAVALREKRVTREELLENSGNWSVIMTAGYRLVKLSGDMPRQRFHSQEVKGSLKFTKANGGQICGTVEMQPDSKFVFLSKNDEPRRRCALRSSCELALQEANSGDIASYEQNIETDTYCAEYLRIANNALAVKANYGGEDLPEQTVTGIIQVVKSRLALPRLDHKGRDPSHLGRTPISEYIESQSIPASEGDILMDKYRNVAGYWLCTRLGMEDHIVRLVRQYLCPEPVFFLEPGDLFIRNTKLDMDEWRYDVNTCQPILLVARPNKKVGY